MWEQTGARRRCRRSPRASWSRPARRTTPTSYRSSCPDSRSRAGARRNSTYSPSTAVYGRLASARAAATNPARRRPPGKRPWARRGGRGGGAPYRRRSERGGAERRRQASAAPASAAARGRRERGRGILLAILQKSPRIFSELQKGPSPRCNMDCGFYFSVLGGFSASRSRTRLRTVGSTTDGRDRCTVVL